MDKSNIVMEMWTVYDHPLDYPEFFVARKWIVTRTDDGPVATDEVLSNHDLHVLRSFLPDGLFCMPRTEGDDPKIIETWF